MIAAAFPLHFLRPWWWLALLPLPLALMALARGRGRGLLARLADAALLPHLVRDAGRRDRAALALAALAWMLAVAALAGPAWQRAPAPLYVNGAARVIVLSLSDDMLAQDLAPDRLTRARFAVRDLLDAAGDARTALVAYGGAAFTVAPLTDDVRTVTNLLGALAPDVMPVPGNDAGAGIARAVELLQHAHVSGGEIVLVTDTADVAATDAARRARAAGIRVDVLGVGTAAGAPVPRAGGGFARDGGSLRLARLDAAALRAVASAGGGRYAQLQPDGGGVSALGAPTPTGASARGPQHARLWRDGGVWLLPLVVVLAALAFRRGWLLVLVVLAWPLGAPVAHAATWDSLWANRDQQAARALQRGDAKRAQALAVAPGMRGAADYRAGEYAKAADAFARGEDARSRYNLGNALAKEGEYQKAIGAYREALRRDPKFVDARANLASIEDWLRRHPQADRADDGPRQSGASARPPSSGAPSSQAGSSGAPSSTGGAGAQGKAGAQAAPSSAATGSAQDQAGAQATRDAGGGARSGGGMPSEAEARRQQEQASPAARGIERELQRAQGQRRDEAASSAGAFALGQSAQDRDGHFNAQQRAMLQAVPDDPGALLRRKFRLEWEQRHGQAAEDGQP